MLALMHTRLSQFWGASAGTAWVLLPRSVHGKYGTMLTPVAGEARIAVRLEGTRLLQRVSQLRARTVATAQGNLQNKEKKEK